MNIEYRYSKNSNRGSTFEGVLGVFFDHFFHIFMDKIRIFERCSICIKRLTHIKLKRMSVLACVNRININQLRTYNCYCQIYIGIVNIYRTYLGYMILT